MQGVDPEFLGDFRGLLFLETEDESPFAPVGLRFGKRISSLSAVPAIRPQREKPQETDLLFPDYVDGEGWSVQLALSNFDPDAAAEVRVEVYDAAGSPVADLFDSDLTLEIPSMGSRVLRSAGSGAIRRGWIQVRTDAAAVSGLLTYRDARSGIEVGVEPAGLGKEFALFVEESGTLGAGLALFKPEAGSGIELRFRDEEGNDPLDGVYVPWRDFHQSAQTLPEWLDVPGVDAESLAEFRGLLFLRTGDESGFAPLGLRFGKRTSSLSAVPAIRIPDGSGIDGGNAPPPTVTISASPTSIDRGGSTTLTWSSTSGESAEITPDVGEVPTSGTLKVTPNVTTTYRIVVTGADGQTASASVTVAVAVSERAVLGALFEALGGSGWTRSDNWGTGAPLADWYGVEVDSQGRVIELRMVVSTVDEDGRSQTTGIGLTGKIPPELGALSQLRVLDLRSNQLSGPIPPELGRLSNLKWLYLFGNQLTGPIPPELGRLSNLTRLFLFENRLTGPIPPELGHLSNLRSLYLGNNQLTGPIPPELGRLSNLMWLNLNDNQLTGSIPAELGGLSNLMELYLFNNQLTGSIPAELGGLSNLTRMYLRNNQLTGPIPPSFLNLELDYFDFLDNANTGICAPGTSDFVSWLRGMEQYNGSYCNESDVAVLNVLYHATGGAEWTNSGGWLGDGAASEWHGVSTDSLGWVTGLDLSRNGLSGQVPGRLGELEHLTGLRIDGNPLSGRLPFSLARLSLREFRYGDTGLCAPVEESFQAWLNAIPSHDGTGRTCVPLTDRDILAALYDATDGPNWTQSNHWLTDSPLGEWLGVAVDGQGRVVGLDLTRNQLKGRVPAELGSLSNLAELDLSGNQLTGPVPPELGGLSNLTEMSFSGNQLTGPVPSELGRLSNLTEMSLSGNQLTGPVPPELGGLSNLARLSLSLNRLTGPIPPELGRLSNLTRLYVSDNRLTGPIPPEFGRLSRLEYLFLAGNQLTGPIPPELGRLSRLGILDLDGNRLTGPIPRELGALSELSILLLNDNQLTGPIPPQLGGMEKLFILTLTRNAGMSGALPDRLTELEDLRELQAGGTGLCVPSGDRFQRWLDRIWKWRIRPCFRHSLPRAILTQAVQSREFPVPLVAGEEALLRVFLTVSDGYERLPPVRARFYVRGRERHVVDIPGASTPVPAEVNEGSLASSAQGEVPGEIVQPGLEMVIEIDPEGTLGSGTGLTKRIPETGRVAVDVRNMPTFDLTLIPFLWRPAQDKSILEMVEGMAANPESHEMLWETRVLLPIGDLDVKAHEPVLSSSNNTFSLMIQSQAIRAMEGASGYYLGMMSGPVTGPSGIADSTGRVSVAIPQGATMAHELGHNLRLSHAPCGGAGNPDRSFPKTDGSIGAWGYDFREGGRLVPTTRPDLMSYCSSRWISDYHFTNALRRRLLTTADRGRSSLVAAPGMSLLLWGGVDAGGAPFLEPAFVVRAPALLPRSTGEYEIIGQTTDGDELFSLQFRMPEVADGDGSSSFAFVLPVQPGWAHRLAGITLSGPGGSATLDPDTERPVTLLRNPGNGQIRAILRGAEAAPSNLDATVSALSLDPGLDRLTSRGIPDPEDWTQ